MTNELHKIIDEGAQNGADPRFVAELRGIADDIVHAQAQEEQRVAKLPELTDERKAKIAERRARFADRSKGTGWKY